MPALPIKLPPGFSPIVTVDESISAGQTIAKYTAQSEEVINIPRQLGIPLKKVKKVLKKIPGDSVRQGEVIAERKKFFGFSSDAVVSEVDGEVARYERETGNLVINTGKLTTEKEIISPVDGTVSLCDNDKIVITTDTNVVTGSKASGQQKEGELFVMTTALTDDTPNIVYLLDNRAIGKIVVGGTMSRELLVKGISIGAKGLVGTHFEPSDLEYIQTRHADTPVMQIDISDIETLKPWNGKKVHLNPEAKALILLQI